MDIRRRSFTPACCEANPRLARVGLRQIERRSESTPLEPSDSEQIDDTDPESVVDAVLGPTGLSRSMANLDRRDRTSPHSHQYR